MHHSLLNHFLNRVNSLIFYQDVTFLTQLLLIPDLLIILPYDASPKKASQKRRKIIL